MTSRDHRVRLRMVQPEHRYVSPLCAPCGGECCKGMPGSTHPDQWGATDDERVAAIAKALASGRWAIDWWEGDPREGIDEDEALGSVRYIRPAMGSPHRFPVEHPAWGREAPCTFLRSTGCALPHDGRPLGCRALRPGELGECDAMDGSKQAAAVVWIPFQSVIALALSAAFGSEQTG